MSGQRNERKTLQQWLESGVEKPVFFVLLAAIVTRAASLYSGGAFSITRILGRYLWVYNLATGLAVALAAELLASVAGRAWRRHQRLAFDALERTDLSKKERQQRAQRETEEMKLSRFFMIAGLATSALGSFFFLFTTGTDHSATGIATDLMITMIVLVATFYFGVLKEDEQTDHREIARATARAQKLKIIQAASLLGDDGTLSATQIAMLNAELPKSERIAVAGPASVQMVDTATIAGWLGDPKDSALRRDITRQLIKASEAPEYAGRGIARTSKTWQVPLDIALLLFHERILARRGEQQQSSDINRQINGSAPQADPALAASA